jgi:two-component system, LytTR family, response regulator
MKTSPNLNNLHFLVLNYGKKKIATPDIQYIEGEGNYSHIITSTYGKLFTSFTLKIYCEQLKNEENFFSPRKGLLLNIQFLKEIKQKDGVFYAQMKDGKSHALSRRKGKAFMEYLLNNRLGNLIVA